MSTAAALRAVRAGLAGPGGFGGGNFDPAQMQQQMRQGTLDQDRLSLAITNDDEWAVIQPLIQKVMDAQQALGNAGGMGGRGNRGGRGGPGGIGAQASEEQLSLQQALANNAPIAQIRDLLAKYPSRPQGQAGQPGSRPSQPQEIPYRPPGGAGGSVGPSFMTGCSRRMISRQARDP